ncbi:MAG: deoxyribodipyrimidine photo-lyase, partial [Deltaproteobacteria bacterium]|nr:deoxyribodipyrimidine photo-lyase [Deltaproteobacteria bacterium]
WSGRGGRLYVAQGDPAVVLPGLIGTLRAGVVHANRDYTPFARRRDDALASACRAAGAQWILSEDLLLFEPEELLSSGGKPYRVFTAFRNAARSRPIPRPGSRPRGRFCTREIPGTIPVPSPSPAPPGAPEGGRARAFDQLRRLPDLRDYATLRDLPASGGTTRLSPHLKFGTVSIREAWHRIHDALGGDTPLLDQLLWRDFFHHVAWHHPHVFGEPFQLAYRRLEWDRSPERLARWAAGRTGVPLVDAGMRELAATGHMHNRARMIAASFLTKDLHLDWREGERVFARRLVDYDPCVNNGGWQWAASTGCDAQPWFRVFNPWRQQARFDPDAVYIRRWIPELAQVPPARILRLETEGPPRGLGYPPPMVEHAREATLAVERYRRVRGREAPGVDGAVEDRGDAE